MNISLHTRRVLAFGGSLVWGDEPSTRTIKFNRLSANVRWTGILQDKLGEDYEIIEEGLCGRTIDLNDPDSGSEDINGKVYLSPCLKSQNPLNYVILLIGNNDLKKVFNRTAKEVAAAVDGLIEVVIEHAKSSDGTDVKILLLSPPIMTKKVVDIKPHFEGAPDKSLSLGREYKKVAKKHKCDFVDLAKHVHPCKEDGLHLDENGHKRIAELVFDIIGK